MAEKKSYEEYISRLKEIIETLESGEVPLEESIKLFGEGTKISDDCYDMLNNAKMRVKELTSEEVSQNEV